MKDFSKWKSLFFQLFSEMLIFFLSLFFTKLDALVFVFVFSDELALKVKSVDSTDHYYGNASTAQPCRTSFHASAVVVSRSPSLCGSDLPQRRKSVVSKQRL